MPFAPRPRPLATRSVRPARPPVVAPHRPSAAPSPSRPSAAPPAPAITLTDAALAQCRALAAKRADEGELVLRVGVKSGGCNGMSYTMDFERAANVRPDDAVLDNDGFRLVCDPKSLLYLFGLQLDFSDDLIGGGFAFRNPNAASTCGCGSSFGV